MYKTDFKTLRDSNFLSHKFKARSSALQLRSIIIYVLIRGFKKIHVITIT